MFDDIKEIYWLSEISIYQERENNISECFDKHLNFKYPRNLEEFDVYLDFFQRRKKTNSCQNNFVGENTLLDKLIVMGDVSDLAGKSENFANFLTVSRKFGFTCVYIFHTINPTKENWQMTISHKNV